MPSPARRVFFLGGRDLEMVEIARLLAAARVPCRDRGLAWDAARLSAYAPEIEAAAADGARAVAVELRDDMPGDWKARLALVLVDHHGARAGGPSSLRQVFDLLGLPPRAWTRRLALVEANDVGHVEAMRALGAAPAEIAAVRAEDRAAQGIAPDDEAAGRAALRAARVLGPLAVVVLPHDRTATVTDPLALDPAFAALPRDVLVLAPRGRHFFGAGRAVLALDRAFPGGWTGGALPVRGFWGHAGGAGAPLPPPDRAIEAARAALAAAPARAPADGG